ncbi:MAG TPA: rhodanese-like domain-containing protein [Acidimicrobiales bacterium]|nr:rhodanese-like domain-containing protein [Acidimicrobiales bacterium]
MPTPRLISGEALAARLEDPAVLVLDVREPDEVAAWAFPGAINIPLGELEGRLDELPAGREVVTVCALGSRATAGAAMLEAAGRPALVLEGGMAAWSSTYDEVEGGFAGATVIQVRRRGKGCLSYVVGAGERCVVIDPSLATSRYQAIAARKGWAITHVLDTHLHADHLSGARALAAASGAELWLNPGDPFAFTFTPISDGKAIELVAGVNLAVSSVSVPGHTEGSTMYQLGEAAIFTGDTLFLESVGRPDLADEAEAYAHHLFRSLHERVLPLSDAVVVFPAHFGPGVGVRAGALVSRPLGELRGTLPPLALDEPDFVNWAVANVKDRPGNYQRIVRINAGREDPGPDTSELETGPNRCAIA